ncbi:HET-domain-containing protein, partial [Trichoderma reesei RUT C-30]
NIRVIDCKSPSYDVISASEQTQYAALSYVWGDPNPPKYPRFTQIVRDAIQATLAMGLEYLWVDQYCINQDDESDKRDQISKMDIIYSHAAITFINAASEPQKHGLPGISTISRTQQLQETFKNVAFIQCFPDISTMVKASPWCTRGWTFQEGFFAPRRVIFTEYGTSYLCHRMHCLE